MKNLRIVFFGTPDFAVASLEALVVAGFEVVAVVTAPDKPAGRGHQLQASAVKQSALKNGLPVLQPEKLKSPEFLDQLRACRADVHVVVAFRMLPEVVWDMPPMGTYNVHASLLPNYRGAAPINWAIIHGEQVTGVTTFKLQHAIDTGSILLQQEVAIEDDDDAGSLHDKLMRAGADLLIRTVKTLAEGTPPLRQQDESGKWKHAPKIFREDGLIHWDKTAYEVRNFIRGLSPVPGAYSVVHLDPPQTWKFFRASLTDLPVDSAEDTGQIRIDGERMLVACRDFWLEIQELQVPGKRRMTTPEVLRGMRLTSDRFSTVSPGG